MRFRSTSPDIVSKTDLALAYLHGVDPVIPAEEVMQSPVHSCAAHLLLEEAIKR